MSTSRQIEAVRRVEQFYPIDTIHNGHRYVHGSKVLSESVRELRRLRKIKAFERTYVRI